MDEKIVGSTLLKSISKQPSFVACHSPYEHKNSTTASLKARPPWRFTYPSTGASMLEMAEAQIYLYIF